MNINEIDRLAESRLNEILNSSDIADGDGTVYYVSAEGNDLCDGTSPERAWRTLEKVSGFELAPGSTVRFRRGDIFRGSIRAREGVTYAAYGRGEKPRFYGWKHDLAEPSLWELYDEGANIWHLCEKIPDCGTLVFDSGASCSRKLIPSYRGGFVCREDEERRFEFAREMTSDLDIFCDCIGELTEKPSKGEDFPVPSLKAGSTGELYLRCDRGNPGRVFASIEALPRRHMFSVGSCAGVTLDNLCIKYVGMHAVAAGGHVRSLTVQNCEIGWIGGAIQHYLGTDPNYPEGRRGSVTRFGNGVEVYGGCEGYRVENCYIYEVYDAAVTHQITTNGKKHLLSGIKYCANLIENCTYSIEYFLDCGVEGSIVDGCLIEGNILRGAGEGWGAQRHNKHTPAHLKGWDYRNPARRFAVRGNIFDRSAEKLVHACAESREYCPEMSGNIYLQYKGGALGRYGVSSTEVGVIRFSDSAVREILRDFSAKAIEIPHNM